MVELIIPIASTLGAGVPAYFVYKAKKDRMKRDEKLIERANPEDLPEIARALNPRYQLGPLRREQQVPPAAEDGSQPLNQGP